MRKIMKKNEKERGFTLVELLIVVAIIAILTGIAIPNFMGARTKARVGRALADMHTIANALEARAIDYGEYATGKGTLPTNDLTKTGLIASIPKDPFDKANDFHYYSSPTSTPVTKWVITSVGPSGNKRFEGKDDWNYVVAGPLGGPESAYTTLDDSKCPWYDPKDPDKSRDDLGYGGVASPE